MGKFWIEAVRMCGAAAISGLLIYTIYPMLISGLVLKMLSSGQVYVVIVTVAVATFIVSMYLIKLCFKDGRAPAEKSQPGNVVTVTSSTVVGDVTGGDKITKD